MGNRLTTHLQEIKANNQGLFIPYIMAGDHDLGLDGLAETLTHLESLGVSAIEIGVPFSDPVADGPVIEQAGQRSLAKGTTLTKLVEVLKGIELSVPLVIMSYLNPIYQYGLEEFLTDLNGTGVAGLIIPDLPFEHEELIKPHLKDKDIALIPLVSLTTPLERQQELLKDAQGFVYAVAINGVTGRENNYGDNLDGHLKRLSEQTNLPVLTGFGVSSPADIDRFNRVSDGVIVGSKIVKALYEKDSSIDALISYGTGYRK